MTGDDGLVVERVTVTTAPEEGPHGRRALHEALEAAVLRELRGSFRSERERGDVAETIAVHIVRHLPDAPQGPQERPPRGYR